MSLCILIPVYYGYRWVALLMAEALKRYWPDHPPAYYCGLSAEEAGGLETLPLSDPALPRDWLVFVHEAAAELQRRGYRQCYLLLEEHLPLGPCHVRHLNETLPALMDELAAVYVGLMGWDNRRYSTRAPLLAAAHFQMMHLSTPQAPRFHLHPSLWRLDALIGCLELVLRDEVHSTWRFEKVTEKPDAALPEEWKSGCYQVCGRAMALYPPGELTARTGQFVFHKLMALYPHLPSPALAKRYWHWIGFDNFFYNGPYPMFFSGVMAKGQLNPYFVNFMKKRPEHGPLIGSILAAAARHIPEGGRVER